MENLRGQKISWSLQTQYLTCLLTKKLRKQLWVSLPLLLCLAQRHVIQTQLTQTQLTQTQLTQTQLTQLLLRPVQVRMKPHSPSVSWWITRWSIWFRQTRCGRICCEYLQKDRILSRFFWKCSDFHKKCEQHDLRVKTLVLAASFL